MTVWLFALGYNTEVAGPYGKGGWSPHGREEEELFQGFVPMYDDCFGLLGSVPEKPARTYVIVPQNCLFQGQYINPPMLISN